MKLSYSIIIPVYNRPEELDELLASIQHQEFLGSFEVCIIEDGSDLKSNLIVEKYTNKLSITYFEKENSGPGDSRNFGMKQAINYSMTSFLTTGGIRGKKNGFGTFQPRSFNMGLSKTAFEKTKGFSDMRAGEDIDLTFRLWEEGFKTQLIEEAFVYHKRRNSIAGFFKQTFEFGTARPILNKKYPQSAKLTYWFPSLFILGFDLSILLLIFGYWQLAILYVAYFVFVYADSTVKNRDFKVGFLSIFTSLTQFIGYGLGFLESQLFRNKK